MRSFVGPLFFFTALSLTLVSSSPEAWAQGSPENTPSRITGAVDNTRLVVLPHSIHPLARPEFDQGPAPADLPFDRMLLVLKRGEAQESALKQLLDQQQDRSSPSYHKWLTPEEFGRRFGPSDHDIQAVTLWLESQGFQVAGATHGRTGIEFSGTTLQVQNAFHTAIHKFVVNGEEHWANANDPRIPAALAPVVAGIARLNNFRKKPQVRVSKQPITAAYQPGSRAPQFTATDGSHGLAPSDYGVIYNINPLYAAGINGTGSIIAIVAKSNIKASDVASFRSVFGLPKNPPTIILNGKDPGLVSGDETEALLDTSWSGAVAPNATIKLVVSADTNNADGVDLSEQYIINHNLADVMSESYGDCEANYAQPEAANIQSLAQQAAAQGITYLVSTGDSGSAGCDDPNSETTATGPFSINILASTPFTVAVGGTEFNENGNDAGYWNPQNSSVFGSALSYIPEDVWNESCTAAQCGASNAGIWAGGGGGSIFFPKPGWQAGVTGIPNDGVRDIPDVSLSAAGHDYYLLCEDGSCTANSKGQFSFNGVSGTSASAPSFAGIMALVKQRTGARQGQADFVLYQLAATESVSACNASNATVPPRGGCIFNDVTIGNNAVPGEVGYGTSSAKFQSTLGYDPSTGLGSVNAANLVSRWSGVSSGSGQASLTPTTMAFGNQSVGSTSAVKTITLTNPGTTPLSISVIFMTGAAPDDFTQVNNCGTALAAGASCSISVAFTPIFAAARSAVLTLSDSATSSPQTVSLSGTGTANSQIAFGGEGSGDVRVVGDFDGDGLLDYATWRPSNGVWYIYPSSAPGYLAEVQWGLPGDIPVLGDFDADGKADLAVWRPSNQTWYFVLSSTGGAYTNRWGLPGDVPVAGDFDGSGRQEMAVWRPSNGNWYVIGGKTGEAFVRQWGLPGDVPVPADYDGDGVTDFAIWRPANGNWYIKPSGNPGAPFSVPLGLPTNLIATKLGIGTLGKSLCVRVLGDFDGDGKTDFAVWQPSTGDWFVIPSGNPGSPLVQPTWGVLGDVPVPGDYDGDGKADFAVWRPSNGTWYVMPSSGASPYFKQFGLPTDIPVIGDFDGDGKTDFAVWRPSNGTWYISPSGGGAAYSVQWGLSGDVPSPGDFEGRGKSDLAVWRPSNGSWYIVPSEGSAPYVRQWGLPGDVPLAGDFNGNGQADLGIWRPSSLTYFTVLSTQPSDPAHAAWGLTGNSEIYKQPR